MILDTNIAAEFTTVLEKASSDEKLLSRTHLDQFYVLFRQRFGPDALAQLDGEALLMAMHRRGSKDSLVYWLEYKNDTEFPNEFGSITGGSAYAYDVYYDLTNET